jgi:maltooligosyltrehalose trehalohydrolase
VSLGATVLPGGGVHFSVWAPRPQRLALRVAGHDLPLERGPGGVAFTTVSGAGPGTLYQYVTDGEPRPDPRSRSQPQGVHGPSQVIDPAAYRWRHDRRPRTLDELVFYELHVGTFTAGGTFRAAIERLPDLVQLGVTAVELMPLAAFPGARNWGYDGVHLYAPAAAYGAPDELRALVDAAHGLGLSMFLDVVYNHLGPEGNYTGVFAPYVTPRHKTLWGDAPDFAERQVRDFVVENAVSWLEEFRFDGLRVDAAHAIVDDSPEHILTELCRRARPAVLVAETDLNDVLVFDRWGFDAVWSDDFHHALHAALTGERQGYYAEFGSAATLARTIQDGWVRGPHPERSAGLDGTRLVVCAQNHDQVGNRAAGERLEQLAGPQAARLAAVATLVAVPGVPLLFMGEELGAATPFQYFTSHGDPDLARAVSEGRKREFSSFGWKAAVPDPQDPATFERSRLDWARADERRVALYRDLLALRPVPTDKRSCRARCEGQAVIVERGSLVIVLNLDAAQPFAVDLVPVLSSEDRRYGGSLDGPGRVVPPKSAGIFRRG